MSKLRVFAQFQKGMLHQYGWFRAWKEGKPVDRNGDPLPWITYPAIDFISQFDYCNKSIFEWGSGYSTLWWIPRCHHIISVETNPVWYERMLGFIDGRSEIVNPGFEERAEAEQIRQYDVRFDVIVIDNNGPFRAACAVEAIPRLAEGGYILLDNSDQCLIAAQILREAGFQQIDFSGYAPGMGYAQTTSLFFKEKLNFKTRFAYQPERSVAQPNPPWPNC